MKKEAAWVWYEGVGAIKGCNYLPRTAVNSTEMWQGETFDPDTIDQELGWAAEVGYNSVRVFLQFLVWRDDPQAFLQRMRAFLAMADKHGIRPMFVPFCDCAFAGKEPYLGPQDEPIPGVHNSGWVPSPGLSRVEDRSAWPELQSYIQSVVGTFARDGRVLMWDLYNEPGASNNGERSLPLVEATFAWAREVDPQQPLTVGPWNDLTTAMSQRFMALSDVVSFHAYDPAVKDVRAKIELGRPFGRPLICTEWLFRTGGNTFQNVLPLFAEERVGWYNWGLVAGRTQTYMIWGSKLGDPMPEVWHHDVLHPDGWPFDPEEVALIRAFSFHS